MYSSETVIRVRYAETDRMGYVYYGNYAAFFESGRVEALRALGLSYKEMEEKGIMLPVLSFNIKYYKPAFFDDVLTIKTTVRELPAGTRIHFHYETRNEDNILINEGETKHAFLHEGRPVAVPQSVIDKLGIFFVK